MADPVALAATAHRVNLETLRVIEERDPERAQRMKNLTPTGSPPHGGQPYVLAAWNAEALAFIVERAVPKPRRRGRPRKAEAS
jgi:hypothetical protein